ncbi:hypothetical protein KQH49_09010, partial [Mycetohabitans sp. B5]|uniref:hypothetical protein n=1 Tax=Mycetohabitans sp. B5 TaxID=2841846 RepID=UPI001F2CB190
MDVHCVIGAKKFWLFAPAVVLPKPLASNVALYPTDDLAVAALSAVEGHGARLFAYRTIAIAGALTHPLGRLDTM